MAARRAIVELEGTMPDSIDEYTDSSTEKYNCMINCIRKHLNLTTLKYQTLEDMIEAIGLPEEKVCTYCWNGKK